ncbi:hypothetical protein R1flu_021517 [Riccia fluitans]|uniref:Uncharacterized protein n=1 Tax=Riccia fluitans TaxID=41844 RepID=A0ABD1ZSR5_9MARC
MAGGSRQTFSIDTISFCAKVRGAALTCFAGLTSAVFCLLPAEKQHYALSVLIYAARKDDMPAVQSSGCRAIGVVVGFPQVAESEETLERAIEVVLFSTTGPSVLVRVTPSWALANVCDALPSIAERKDGTPIPSSVGFNTALCVQFVLMPLCAIVPRYRKRLVYVLKATDSEHNSELTGFKYLKALTEQRSLFILDLFTARCSSVGSSGMRNVYVDEAGVLGQMAEVSILQMAADSSSKGLLSAYDDNPLPPPKEKCRYGLKQLDDQQ